MSTLFTAQLARIAATSTHELDTKARRNLHAESLLFSRDVAARQDFDTIYGICNEGFRELCLLDSRFGEFERNLFSQQAKEQDREQMNRSENEAIDSVIERLLHLLGARILLNPAAKVLEWLVRRFRVHVHNIAAVLLTVLPYHESPIWRNVLSIIPASSLNIEWKWIAPYRQDSLNLPRHTIVYALTNNDGFWSKFNGYLVAVARERFLYQSLLQFWSSVVVEAIIGRLAAAKSGRREVQRQRMEDALLKILPVLSDGFEIRGNAELNTALSTIAMVLAAKADLDDRVLDTLLQTVALSIEQDGSNIHRAIITMSAIANQKRVCTMPRATVDAIRRIPELESRLEEVSRTYSVTGFIEACVEGALASLTSKKRNSAERVSFVQRLLHFCKVMGDEAPLKQCIHRVLTRTLELLNMENVENPVAIPLVAVLQNLNEDAECSRLLAQIVGEMGRDIGEIEALLGQTTRVLEAPPEATDMMEVDVPSSKQVNLEESFAQIPSRTADTSSFLGHYNGQLYEQLVQCFISCCKSEEALQRFCSLPIWSSALTEELLLASFLLRIGVGQNAIQHRAIAISLLTRRIDRSPNLQIFLPYAIIALRDPALMVRRASSELIVAMNSLVAAKDTPERTGDADLYATDRNQQLSWMSIAQLKNVTGQVLLPNLEECVLDRLMIDRVMDLAFNGTPQSETEGPNRAQTELKKSVRNSLFEMLTSHGVATPLWHVKLVMLKMLTTVHKVGTLTKTNLLAPILKEWSSLSEERVRNISLSEHFDAVDFDKAIANSISPDRKAVDQCLTTIQDQSHHLRPNLVIAFYGRVQELWSTLRDDSRNAAALKLFEMSFSDGANIAVGARTTLQTVDLSTDQLGAILELAMSSFSEIQTSEQPRKRRRTSHGHDHLPPDLARLVDAAVVKLTLALELIDNSKAEKRPELLAILFDVLAFLKRSKQQRLESPYVVNLCLASILNIVDAQKLLPKPSIDISTIRTDLVVDFVRSSDNPQVETTALSLSSSLASLAPDRMLHNVMPIFTFMGQNMFSKEDNHSINVVSQAIDQIIPALVESLRKQNVDIIKSTAGLLSSFAAAYDHIPQYRRVAVYRQLLNRMVYEDFTFILIAMLAVRQPSNQTFMAFMDKLLAELPPYAQLVTYRKLIYLANDLASPQSKLAADLFDIDSAAGGEQHEAYSLICFNLAVVIPKSQSLKAAYDRLHKVLSAEQDMFKRELITGLRETLSTIRSRKTLGQGIEPLKQCLESLLGMPPLSVLITLLPEILDDMEGESELRPQILRVLAAQLEGNPPKDKKTRTAAIELLSVLTRMLQRATDSSMKQAIIICMDRLSEAYGRKNIGSVVTAAAAVSSDNCLLSDDNRVVTLSLLSLASMLEVVKEACAPIILDITSKLIRISEKLNTVVNEELYAASNTLLVSMFSHVSFLISETDLQKLLSLCTSSAQGYTSSAAKESRSVTLNVMAKTVDLSSLLHAFQGLESEQKYVSQPIAKLELLEVLSTAIESATKANVIRNADSISKLLLSNLDYRRMSGDDAEQDSRLLDIENKVSDLAIQYIYKLNDTTFRPIFETWVDWTFSAHDLAAEPEVDTKSMLRQLSMFGLLTQFFSTLKSLVTSYSTYFITPAATILEDLSNSTKANKKTTLSTLQTKHFIALLTLLQNMFAHDADGFFSTPSHFQPLGPALVAQLTLASSKPHRTLITTQIIPTLVTLAKATIDTPTHHQTLTHHLTKLRHDSSSAVRLASIKTLAAITSDEDVGDDFIANTIGVGSAVNNDGDAVGIARGGGSSAGELMIYVNEMLEDDDEDVENEVRRWVQSVREKVGEEVFEL